MYIDLVIFIVLIAIIFIFFRKFSSIVYFVAFFDILLRILTFIKTHIPLEDVAAVINNYIPENIPSMIGKYITGIPYDIFLWLYVGLFIIFEFYIIRTFWKKRR